ncbi:MAG TPA: aminodeoxychorismate/anthranilate synthase component II [Chitinophagaceae bacterium]
MKLLVFDNYDSFTYNLVHRLEAILHHTVDVYRNDAITLNEVQAYDRIVLSPGPGLPGNAGLLIPLIRRFAAEKKILGVCLGHQAIAEAFGGSLVNLETVHHGVSRNCHVTDRDSKLFQGLPPVFQTGRYHSWVVDESKLPDELRVTARDDNGYIMALEHRNYSIQGLQFHPESVLTPLGDQILENWLSAC